MTTVTPYPFTHYLATTNAVSGKVETVFGFMPNLAAARNSLANLKAKWPTAFANCKVIDGETGQVVNEQDDDPVTTVDASYTPPAAPEPDPMAPIEEASEETVDEPTEQA